MIEADARFAEDMERSILEEGEAPGVFDWQKALKAVFQGEGSVNMASASSKEGDGSVGQWPVARNGRDRGQLRDMDTTIGVPEVMSMGHNRKLRAGMPVRVTVDEKDENLMRMRSVQGSAMPYLVECVQRG